MTHYNPSPGMVRLDIHQPSGTWYDTVALDMTDFYRAGPTVHEAVEAAIKTGCQYGLGQWTFTVREPYHQQAHPVIIVPAAAAESEEAATKDRKTAALEDLITSLHLYVGRHTWTQLTTAQKELFADTIDSEHASSGEDDGYRVERWWRD